MRDNITCHKYFIITTQINSSSNDVNNRKNWNETETEIETALRAQKWRERRWRSQRAKQEMLQIINEIISNSRHATEIFILFQNVNSMFA